jgi:hypothetical protein
MPPVSTMMETLGLPPKAGAVYAADFPAAVDFDGRALLAGDVAAADLSGNYTLAAATNAIGGAAGTFSPRLRGWRLLVEGIGWGDVLRVAADGSSLVLSDDVDLPDQAAAATSVKLVPRTAGWIHRLRALDEVSFDGDPRNANHLHVEVIRRPGTVTLEPGQEWPAPGDNLYWLGVADPANDVWPTVVADPSLTVHAAVAGKHVRASQNEAGKVVMTIATEIF